MEYYSFEIEDGTLVRYTGDDRQIIIPDTVKRIAPYAFYNCKTLEKVVTPVKLARIGKGAFYGCDALKDVTIPGRIFKRVKGNKIFSNFDNIYFRFYASSGETIPDEISFENYPVPEGADVIADVVDGPIHGDEYDLIYADEAVYDEVVESQEEDRFIPLVEEPEESESLREKIDAITPEEEDEKSAAHKKAIIDVSDFLIEDTTVIKYIGAKKSVVIPDFITHIGVGAFSNEEVEEVTFPEGLEAIGKGAFTWCVNIKKLVLPQSLTLIDDLAFSECGGLEEIEIPDSVKYIGESAFHACSSLKSIKLPSELTTVSRRAFDFCVALKTVTVPEGVEVLGDGAFSHCEGLERVVLPESLKEINNWAFAECYDLRDINFPSALEVIGDVAFMNCREMRKLDLPYSVKHLGRQSFVGCTGLTIVTMSEALQKQVKPLKVFHGLKNVQVELGE